ncbi:hypothetical protein M404DRAFT_33819 [Pisolithus tinctorius Marx 270]|uniref:Uncharacterized protein n=1 Tax=Pisolithus tinctorius Marx 270 TaxID=870435 RepID=A0A0C3IFS8_PISTI|nr:hypothetical protein M404DRAFT_33819 [Pisolithus tinctorius Marx 270]
MSAGTGLDSPGFCFDSRTYYLHLSYSRGGRQLRRSATSVPAIKTQESMLERQRQSSRIQHPTSMDMEPGGSSFYFCFTDFDLRTHDSRVDDDLEGRSQRVTEQQVRRSHGSIAGLARRLRFNLQQRSSETWDPTSIYTERDGSGFSFNFATFYLLLHRTRVGDSVEDGTRRHTAQRPRQLRDARREAIKGTLRTSARVLLRVAAQQWILELQQDTQEARGIEAMPSGLEGPKFSFFFGVLYLRLRCFREYKPSQSIDESSSSDVPVVRREIWYLRGSASDVQVARVRGWEVTYEKGQQTVGVKRRDAAQRCYYEWGEWVQYTRGRMLTLQCSIEGKEMFNDEGREAARRILAMTTGLDVDRQPHKIGSVIRWRQSTMGTDPELDSSSFRFDFKMLYLRLRYSRGNRYLRQVAVAIRESTTSFEQSTHESKTYNEIDARPLPSEGEEDGVGS